jgi:hypothetical protein
VYDPGETELIGNQLPGWTIETNHAVTVQIASGPYLTISGNYSVNTDGEGYDGNNASFFQDFASQNGASYALEFNWQSWGTYTTPTTNQLEISLIDIVTTAVLFDGRYSYDGTGQPHPVHDVLTNFVGTGNSLRLRIQETPQSGYNDNTFVVDNFSVTAVPGVAVPPVISAQPPGEIVTNGSPAYFPVGVSGAVPLFYQWQRNGTNLTDGGNISGSSTNALSLNAATATDGGNYSVIITSTYGSVTSSTVTLTVVSSATNQFNVLLPLTTGSGSKLDLGSFAPGTVIQLSFVGHGDLVNSSYQTFPDGSLFAPAGSPYGYANPGSTNFSTIAGGDGVNHYPGGGGIYDAGGGSGFPFAGKATTDTTDPAGIRDGAVVGTFNPSPANTNWFDIGYGGTFVVPAGGAHLYVAVNDTVNSDDHGTYYGILATTSGAGTTITWTNAVGGSWNNAANWSPNQVPGPLDTATANLGVPITVGSPVTVSNFTFNGTLGGSGALTVLGNMNWVSGELDGALTMGAGGVLNMNNSSYSLDGALTNFGTLAWTNATLFGYTNAQIYNAGLFLIQSDDALYNWDGLTNKLFVNAGTIRKTGGAGTTEIEWPFTTTGTMDTQSGALELDDWTGANILNGNLNSDSSVLNGTLTVTTNSVLNVLSGNLSGAMTVNAGGTLNLTNNAGYSLYGALTNFGTLVWSHSDLFGYTNAQIYNAGLFLIESDNALYNWDSLTNKLFVNVGTVRKTGGAGTSEIEWPFDDSGVVDVQSGTLDLDEWEGSTLQSTTGSLAGNLNGTMTVISGTTVNWSGNLNGAMTVATNAAVNWLGGTLNGTATVASGGALTMTNNSSYSLDGALTNFGTMVWSNATFFGYTNAQIYNAGLFLIQSDDALYNWDGLTNKLFVNTGTIRKIGGAGETDIEWPFTTTGTMDIQSGWLYLPEWIGTNTLNGVLNSEDSTLTGTLTVATNAVWNLLSGDTLNGALTVNAGGTLNFSGASFNFYSALTNFGTMIWSNSTIFGYTNAQIYNAGLCLIPSDSTLYNWDGLTNKLFVNAGTIRKTGGTGTSGIEWPLTTTGTMDIQSGILEMDDSFVQTAGLTLLDGGNLSSSQQFQLLGGALKGTNTFTGNILNGGTVNPGFSPGQLNINGNYTQNSNGVLQIELAGTAPGTGFDQLAVSGTASLNGTLNVTFLNGFQPVISDTFTFLTIGGRRSGDFANFFYPSNVVEMSLTNTPASSTLTVTNTVSPSPVQIVSPQLSGGSFNLSFPSVNGRGYTLYYNDNLATTNWLPYTNVSGNGGTLQLSVPVTNSAQRFFRIGEP